MRAWAGSAGAVIRRDVWADGMLHRHNYRGLDCRRRWREREERVVLMCTCGEDVRRVRYLKWVAVVVMRVAVPCVVSCRVVGHAIASGWEHSWVVACAKVAADLGYWPHVVARHEEPKQICETGAPPSMITCDHAPVLLLRMSFTAMSEILMWRDCPTGVSVSVPAVLAGDYWERHLVAM